MLLILWIIIAIACAVIMQAKGRSAVGGFILGFCFSLIGLIICACLPSRLPTQVVILTPDKATARQPVKNEYDPVNRPAWARDQQLGQWIESPKAVRPAFDEADAPLWK